MDGGEIPDMGTADTASRLRGQWQVIAPGILHLLVETPELGGGVR